MDEITKLAIEILKQKFDVSSACAKKETKDHPMLGRRCLIRTYSAGVHIGDIVAVDGMEVHLKNALRLWRWENGGLSLSAVAQNGIKGGRLNYTGEVYLTNAIEIIPTTNLAEATYAHFIEDKTP